MAISPDSPGIASQNIKEHTLQGTEIISGTGIVSGTTEISLLEMPFRMITPTERSTIRTTAIMTRMLTTIPMDNPHQPKLHFLRRPLLRCNKSYLSSATIMVRSMA